MLRLAWQTANGRKAGFAGSFVALAFALLLVTTCGVLMESALRAEAPTERYAATPVVIGGQPVVTDAGPLAEELAAAPGVAAAVPELSFPVTAVGGTGAVLEAPWDGPSLGHSWESARLAPFRLREGRAPRAAGEVVLDSGLATAARAGTGDRVRLTTTAAPRTFRVVGVADPPSAPLRQFAVFFSPGEASELAATARPVRAIGVLPRAGTDQAELVREVRRVVAARYPDGAAGSGTSAGAGGTGGGAPEEDRAPDAANEPSVATGQGRAGVEFWGIGSPGDTLSSLVGALGVISLSVAAFVTAGTLALSVRQRLREIGLLRAVGATPRQIRRMIAAETLLVTLAAAVGVPAGIAFAAVLHGRLVDGGVLPPSLVLHAGPVAPWAAVAVAVVTAQLAVLGAARKASRVRPTEVLREASGPTGRTGPARIVAGLAVLAVGGAVLASVASGRGDGGSGTAESMVLVLMVGVALLGPLIARVAGAVLGGPVARLFPVGGFLAAANLRAEHHRLAAAVTPLVLAVAFTCTVLSVPGIKADGAEREERRRVLADQVVRATGAGLPARFAEEAAALPGVRAATGLLYTPVELAAAPAGGGAGAGDSDDSESLASAEGVAVRPEGLASLLDLEVRAGSLAGLRGATVALGAGVARETGAGVGATVRIRWEDGTRATARVVAVYERERGLGGVLLPRAFAAPHAASPMDESVLVRTAPGADRDRTAERLDALAAGYPTARPDGAGGKGEGDAGEGGDARSGGPDPSAAFGLLLLGMVNAFTAIAVVNTLAMATAGRVREFAVLRSAGATRGQVLRMTGWEGVITVLVALAVGTVVTAAVLVPVSLAATGSPVPAVPAAPVGAVLAGAGLLGVVTVVLSARLSLRAGEPPREAPREASGEPPGDPSGEHSAGPGVRSR